MKFKKQAVRAILQAIDKLTDQEISVINLKYIEGEPNEEVADTLNLKVQHVRVIDSRAIEKLSNMVFGE
jgi:RNA polymerase sigma factor (sigma-70 family)